MPRMPRLVVPGYPHHVTQRGARRQPTFFCDQDYRDYLDLLARSLDAADVAIWAYCLMPNHVHLVAVPRQADSLARLFGEVHRRYTWHINRREGWRGHLWQERFHSFVMDDDHLLAATRYVERNPVRGGLCASAADWPWSSVHAHLRGTSTPIVDVGPMLQRISSWGDFVEMRDHEPELERIRHHQRTGRPVGTTAFVERLAALTGRPLRKGKPGPPPADK